MGLWPTKLYGLEPRKFCSPIFQGLCCLFPEHSSSPCSLSFPSGDPLEIQNTPSLKEYYLLQIGAALHMVWKELTPLPPSGWPIAPLLGPSQQQISHWGNLCPPQRKKIQANLTCKPLSFQCQDWILCKQMCEHTHAGMPLPKIYVNIQLGNLTSF